MAMNQHVVPSGGEWKVRRARSQRASGVFKTKPEAVEAARLIARNQGADVFIHDMTGRIERHEQHAPRDSDAKF